MAFIRLNRKFFNHSFWKEDRVYSLAEAWLDLIASARFEVAPEKIVVKMQIITIQRGELRASQRYLAERWHWSVGKVNRYINMLENESMIERRSEHSETVIILCNYEDYNPLESKQMNTDGYTNGHSDGTRTEHGRNTDGYKLKKEKKEKELKELKKESAVIFPFQSENFKTIWINWLEYKKKEFNFKYKSSQSEQASLIQLSKLSNGEELTAIEIIKQSMANGWKGFFELKNKKNGTEKREQVRDQVLRDIDSGRI